MFGRYALRTLDVDAARRFYAEAIGLELPPHGTAPGSVLEAWPLHERARALGAPPHWLGQVLVDDVEAAVDRLLELGAERLGPTVSTRDGTAYATLRAPTGEVVAVRAGAAGVTDDRPVAWHQLHTRDADRAWSMYSGLFGWAERGIIDVPDPAGGHRLFAWRDGGEPVGSMANTARWQGVHVHWLFHFPVADVDAAATRVRQLGGTALPVHELPDGTRLSACEDPQGAAFGLIRRSST